MPRPIGRLSPGAVAAIALALALVAAILGLVQGCGKSADTAAGKPSEAKSLLTKEPIDKKAFEAAVLGRSTREVAEMLGAPVQTLNGQKRTGWEYPIRPKERSGVVIFFRDDRVVEVDWGGN